MILVLYISRNKPLVLFNIMLKYLHQNDEKLLKVVWVSLFDKVDGNFIKKKTLLQVFFCKFFEIFKNTYFVTYQQLLLNLQACSTRSLETMTKAKNLDTYHEYKFIRRTMLRYYEYLWLSFRSKLSWMINCLLQVLLVSLSSCLTKALFWNFLLLYFKIVV